MHSTLIHENEKQRNFKINALLALAFGALQNDQFYLLNAKKRQFIRIMYIIVEPNTFSI